MEITETVKNVYEETVEFIRNVLHDYMPQSTLTSSVIVGAVTGTVGYLLLRKKYRLPPGPYALPLIGNLHYYSSNQENFAKMYYKLTKKYGPIFTLYMGPRPAVILNSIEVINEVLLHKGSQCSDREVTHSFSKPTRNGQDIVFSRYGTGLKLRRKIASRAIRLFLGGGSLNTKVEHAVSRTIKAMLEEKTPFDPDPYLHFTMVNILAATCFGKRFDYDDDEFLHVMNMLKSISDCIGGDLLLEDVFPPLRLFPSKNFHHFQQTFENMLIYLQEQVQQHRENFQQANTFDLTDYILQSQKQIEEEGKDNMADFNDLHVSLTIFDIFIAGNDTSRQTLYWALLLIAAHPEVQTKIQQEVDSACGKDQCPTLSDRENLPYTDAVLHEVMRYGPVVPMGVVHNASCDTTIGGYDIPKGTSMFINHWAIMHDPNIWKDVDKFKPERFLEEGGKMAPKPQNWLPFSAGRRVCLGEPLAKPDLHLIIAAFFQKVSIALEPGTPVNIEVKEDKRLYLPHPYKITITERQ